MNRVKSVWGECCPTSICSEFVYGEKDHKRLIWAANKNPNKMKVINASSVLKMSTVAGCSNQIVADEHELTISNNGRGMALFWECY